MTDQQTETHLLHLLPGARAVATTLAFGAARREDHAACAPALRDLLGLGPESPVALARQVHGTEIRCADDPSVQPADDHVVEVSECDGLWTENPGVVVVIRTADCVPVVVSDGARPFVGAVHAGWRGSLGGILSELISIALRRGSRADDLHVWIGPHIQCRNYEVSAELAAEFLRRWGHLGPVADGRHVDLTVVNRGQAVERGVPAGQVASSGVCTFESGARFPSYRRDGRGRGQIYTAARIEAGTPGH